MRIQKLMIASIDRRIKICLSLKVGWPGSSGSVFGRGLIKRAL